MKKIVPFAVQGEQADIVRYRHPEPPVPHAETRNPWVTPKIRREGTAAEQTKYAPGGFCPPQRPGCGTS